MSPLMLAGAALAISVAANAGMTWLWLGARDDRVVAETQRDQARQAATACSDATWQKPRPLARRAAAGQTRS
jgi:hypothetical protein